MAAMGPWSKPTLAVAVSGGPDSLALLLLAQEWAQEHGGNVVALHVDHRLRTTSQAEAQHVQEFCQQHHISCHILVWHHGDVSSKIQQMARHARYSLLLKQCATLGILYLLTAHHRNDQLETIQMRSLRKSGPRGLAGIQAITWTPTVKILRPLLDWPKSELLDHVKDLPYIQDPSNQNDAFTRVRIRKALDNLTVPDLEQRIQEHAHMQVQRTQAEQEAWDYLAAHAILHPWGFATLNNVQEPPPPMATGLILQYVSGRPYLPDAQALKKLMSVLGNGSSKAFTIHSCTAWRQGNVWYFTREHRRPLRTKVTSVASFYWDHRFLVDLIPQNALYLGLELGMLGKKGRQKVCQLDGKVSAPWRILESLPAFWIEDTLASVPHLGIDLVPNVFPRLRFMPQYDILRFETTEQE